MSEKWALAFSSPKVSQKARCRPRVQKHFLILNKSVNETNWTKFLLAKTKLLKYVKRKKFDLSCLVNVVQI